MSAGTRRKWWRAAALAVACGGIAGAWYGFARAEPIRSPGVKVEDTVWTRAGAPAPTPSPAVTPAAAPYFPTIPHPVTPAAAEDVPPAPAPLVPPLPVPATPTPVPPATPASLAATPATPEFKPVSPRPAAAADDRPAPKLPPLPDLPAPKATLPAPTPLPPLPVPVGSEKSPAKPETRPVPAGPVVPPPPVGIAPPAPPAKSADPVKPVPPAVPDFSLRPGNDGNSVKPDTQAGASAPKSAALPPVPVGVPAAPASTAPAVAPPARPVSRAKPADGPLPPSEKSVFAIPVKPEVAAPAPVVGVPAPVLPATPTAIERPTRSKPTTLAPTPGDDPMNLKQSALAAALGGALAFPSPAPATFPVPPLPVAPAVVPALPVKADPPTRTTDEKLKDIDKKLDELTELLRGKKDAQGFVLPTDPGLVADVRKLKDELAALKAQMEEMKKSTSLRPSTGGTTTPAADPLAGKGTVRVVNDYPVEITMVVNNNSYRIAPNTKVDITIPVGTFTYQLLSAGANLAPTSSAIKEKEVVTLRIK